jgi:uncharacterized protein YjiS (DUF1127 family)
MREYIEYVAQIRAPLGLLGKLHLHYKNWCLRRDMRRLLSQLSDYQLRDIGITRFELNWLMAQPRDCDLRWEIGQLSEHTGRVIHLTGPNPQSGTPEPGATWKSESPA